jgi:retinitis pigmentosa 1
MAVIKYEVSVTTGDLWNAGTDANVYLTVYGDRGDTGVRQLFIPAKEKGFKKGSVMTDLEKILFIYHHYIWIVCC